MKVNQEFFIAYITLLHAEAVVIGNHCLETNLNDLVAAHNIIEDAKNRVVAAHLPYKHLPYKPSVVQKN